MNRSLNTFSVLASLWLCSSTTFAEKGFQDLNHKAKEQPAESPATTPARPGPDQTGMSAEEKRNYVFMLDLARRVLVRYDPLGIDPTSPDNLPPDRIFTRWEPRANDWVLDLTDSQGKFYTEWDYYDQVYDPKTKLYSEIHKSTTAPASIKKDQLIPGEWLGGEKFAGQNFRLSPNKRLFDAFSLEPGTEEDPGVVFRLHLKDGTTIDSIPIGYNGHNTESSRRLRRLGQQAAEAARLRGE